MFHHSIFKHLADEIINYRTTAGITSWMFLTPRGRQLRFSERYQHITGFCLRWRHQQADN